MKEKRKPIDYILFVILLLWTCTILLPLFWIIFESFKTNREFYADIWKVPEMLQWVNYKNAWVKFGIGSSMLNTLYYVGGALTLSVFFTTINAYAFTRLVWKGRKFIFGTILLGLFLPGINALIPQFVVMRSLGLTNSLSGLIVLESFGESVFFLMLLGGFMQSLPKEMEESGFIDGASLFQVFSRIIVPLAVPGIVTVTIFKFLGLYNSFLYPFIYLSDQSKYTIGVQMYNARQLMLYSSDWVTLFAGVTIAMVPTIIAYICFQKLIMEGATLGGVKG